MLGRLTTLAAVATLMACSAPSGAGAATAPKPTQKATLAPVKDAGVQTTALHNVLGVFVSVAGRDWKAYDAVTGTTWLSAEPSEYAQGRFQRSGRLLLAGFGTAKVPNGKTGPEYATVEDNEGRSGLTLTGDADQVQMLSVRKFYFSEDYKSVLQGQFGAVGQVTPVAQNCSSEEEAASKPAFFEIELELGKKAYVEAFLEDGGKYAPGYTVFDFTRDKPADRIKELNCQE